MQNEHFMWHYISYKAYLLDKEETEYNGNETYIMDLIKKQDLGWFPQKRTKSINDDDEEKKNN